MHSSEEFLTAEFRNMSRLKRTRSSEKHSRDDEEAIKERKRRKFLEFLEGKQSNSESKLRSPKTVKHEDGGRKSKEDLQNLEEEKPAKISQTVVSATQHDDGNVFQVFGSPDRSHKQEDEFRTRSEIRNGFCRRPITRSSSKADRILKENSLDNRIITNNDESKLNQDNMSVETITEINKPSLQTPSLSRRPLTRSSTMAKPTGRSPAAKLRLCSICNKTFPNLSTVPGSNLFLCSVCRRKSKAVDTVSPLNIDFQTRTTKSPGSGRKQRNYIRERDFAGRTPDTAVNIDSSDVEEEALNNTGSAMNSHEQHWQSDLQCPVKRIAYPSRTDPGAIEISDLDIQRLEPSEFLNDTIIDFYIKYIQREFLSLEGDSRFHFFNSFFYKKLSGLAGKKVCKKVCKKVYKKVYWDELQCSASHDGVIYCPCFVVSFHGLQKKKNVPDFSKLRKWTKGINIFEKDYLIIPVHDKLHWSLAIICFPKHGPGSSSRSERCILHLDSMTCGHQSLTIFRLLRRYLMAEWKDNFGEAQMKGDENIHTLTCNVVPGKKVPVPLQENESDCGLFLLHYIRKFVESAPRSMKISDLEDRLEDLGVFGREWFSPVEASNLRTSIQKKLQSLFAENEMVVGKSSDTSFGNNDIVKPRNLEAEFREYL